MERCCGPVTKDDSYDLICLFLDKCTDGVDGWCEDTANCNSTTCAAGTCDEFCDAVLECIDDYLCESDMFGERISPEDFTSGDLDCLDDNGCDTCCENGIWSCGGEFDCDQDCDGDIDCDDLKTFVSNSLSGCPDDYDPPTHEDVTDLVCYFMEQIAQCSGSSDLCETFFECLGEILLEELGELPNLDDILEYAGSDCGDCVSGLNDPRDGNAPDGDGDGDVVTCRVGGGAGPSAGSGGAAASPGPNPSTDVSVDLAYGDKVESAVDISIALPGQDFQIRRYYRSELDYEANDLSGEKWSIDAFRFMSPEDGSGLVTANLGGPWHPLPAFDGGSMAVNGTWAPEGSTSQYVEKTTVTIDSDEYAVYRIHEPGQWQMDFYRETEPAELPPSGSVEDTPSEFVGLPLQYRDNYGNTKTFEYFSLLSTATSGNVARLNRIVLEGATEYAQIWFVWNLVGGGTNGNRLQEIRVFRPDGGSGLAMTQRVAYTYFESGQGYSADVGSDGDLIQVKKYVRVDPGPGQSVPSWRVLVTQYRYHGGSGAAGSVTTNSNTFNWDGGDHQLKMVIQPEQVEYACQQQAAEDAASSTVDALADALLAKADGAVAWTSGDDVIDLAGKIIEKYETGMGTAGRVTHQYLQAGCGCGGAGSGLLQSYRMVYSYLAPSSGDFLTTKIEEETGGGTWPDYRVVYHDMELLGTKDIPYLVNTVVQEPSGREWVTHYNYSADADRNLIAIMPPAAKNTYSFAVDSGADPSYDAVNSGAVIYRFGYATENYQNERSLQDGETGDIYPIEKITYGDVDRDYLVTKVERYRVETTLTPAANDVEVTDYDYTFHNSGADDIASIKTTVEAELSTENGPGGSYESWEFYDTRGLNTWSVDATNCFTKRTFDSTHGRVTKIERNVVKTGAPTGAPATDRHVDGEELVTSYTYDLLGRLQEVTTPAGVKTYTLREMRESPSRPYLTYYAQVTLPHDLGSSEYNGPASISWMNASGDQIESRTYEIDTGGYTLATGTTGYQPIMDDYDLKDGASQHLSASLVVQDPAGLVTASKVWHSIAGNGENGGVYETKYEYDDLGRLERTINSNDTVYESVYDVLDRVIESKVGILSGGSPTDMATVVEYFYDHTGTTTPGQGMGNGNLSWIRQHTGESGGAYRDTVHSFNWRDQRFKSVNPEPPHEWVVYDNLDRVTERGLFSAEPTAINSPLSGSTDYRGRYEEMAYSQRGLMYEQRVAIDPTAGSPTFLETHRWFDDAGRVVGSWGPNGPSSKITYDGLGRTAVTYITDRRTSTSGTYDTAFADIYDAVNFEADLDDDAVIEQMEYTYNTSVDPPTGLLEMTTTRRRTHRASTTSDTGDLASISASKEITTYVRHFYDDAARPTHVANYGTNESQFEADGTAPTDTSPPTPSATILVSETAYNTRGLVDLRTAPDGQKTKYVYDDMNRQIAVVEGQVGVIASDISWDATNSRWKCGDDLDEGDEDRVTSFVYDGLGNVIKQVAHVVDSGAGNAVQVTSYDFGVSKGVNTNDDDSLIASNDLLAEVAYPDAQGGAATDTVTYAYNRLGELRFMEDQNETTHVYTRDDAGRVTDDEAAIAMGSDIDDTHDTLTFSYDGMGRLDVAETEAKAGGVVNGVQFAYNGLWQVTSVKQDHDSAIGDVSTTNTVEVAYTYEQSAAAGNGSGNYSRLDSLTYPTDTEDLYSTYGTADRLDDAISRVKGYSLNTKNIVDYEFVGSDIFVLVEYLAPVIELTRYHAHNGSTTDGEYPGLDRFGRVVRQMWTDDGAFTTHATLTTVAAVPPIVELEYTYDEASNRTAAYDARPGGQQPLSHEYTYDGLDRLSVADRGIWNGSTFTQDKNSQAWTLDLLGNWDEFKVDADGNGTYAASETEDRDHNSVNELDLRTPGTGSAIDLEYDGAGNLRTEEVSSSPIKTYTHDPWNRLVSVTMPSVAGEEYEYNALNWRTVKRADTDDGGSFDQERIQYYSADWQLLEERIDDDAPFTEGSDIDRVMGYVWGSRYIDDIVMRQVDTDNDGTYEDEFFHLTDVLFSTVVITDEAGTIEERVSYDAYGTARHHWAEDVDGDGDVDLIGAGSDKTIVSTIASGGNNRIGQANYRSEADLDRDGDVDSTDAGLITTAKAALASGDMTDRSAVDNQVGWVGYLYCHDVELSAVRYRHYDPASGRWMEREPLGYVAGNSLYQYSISSPVGWTDAWGLEPGPVTCPPGLEGEECGADVVVGGDIRPLGTLHVPLDDPHFFKGIWYNFELDCRCSGSDWDSSRPSGRETGWTDDIMGELSRIKASGCCLTSAQVSAHCNSMVVHDGARGRQWIREPDFTRALASVLCFDSEVTLDMCNSNVAGWRLARGRPGISVDCYEDDCFHVPPGSPLYFGFEYPLGRPSLITYRGGEDCGSCPPLRDATDKKAIK